VDPEVLETLRKQDWSRIGRVLVLHVHRRSRIRAWREGVENLSLGLGRSAEDIVGDVITKVFAGERTWDPGRGELLPTLRRMVESELDHLWRKHAYRREQPRCEGAAEQEHQESMAIEIDPPLVPADPVAVLERREEMLAASARINALFAAVEGEPELQEVIEAIMEGCEPEPRHLAQHLGVPSKEINNRRRRLRRMATE
jgi:DNA-directed RNA polymerase specialized sigma24 family protein